MGIFYKSLDVCALWDSHVLLHYASGTTTMPSAVHWLRGVFVLSNGCNIAMIHPNTLILSSKWHPL